ncbi:MAG TPA: NAD(P)-binding domain-containing protein [Phycisphaerales bacterium]|nr:NAD(P)-binding domain-containing protein [Phycisphaerales bacterium]
MHGSIRPAIIGAGPIGLEVAWALRREGLDPLHFDAEAIGATMGWWAPGTRFFSSPERIAICGVPLLTPHQDKATREEYLTYLRGVAAQFGLHVRTFERVERIEPPAGEGAPFHLHTLTAAGEHTYEASHVIATIGDMHRPRLLNIPGEDQPNVSHYFQDPHVYFGRRILIVGGKNSAVEAAIRCYRAGARVTISYRGAEFDDKRVKYWLLPELKGLIKDGHIAFLPQTLPTAINATRVELARTDANGQPTPGTLTHEADDILLLTGYEMDGSLLAAAGVTLHGLQHAPTFDRRTMETNVPRLYVAGTATAGTQSRFRVFIENCHDHALKIAAHLTGRTPPREPEHRPEALLET